MSEARKERRHNGKGSVYYLESRERWMASFIDATGRRKVKTAPVNTKAGAQAHLRRLIRERDRGDVVARPPTVAQFVDQWLESKQILGCRPRTIDAYRERMRAYVLPKHGKLRIDKLTATMVERLYGAMLKRGLSPSTVGDAHQTLHNMLKLAKRRRFVSHIVTEEVDPPRVVKFRARPLSVEEARALLEGVRGHHLGPLWTFLLGTGCRFGEAAGLMWSDVDLEAGLVTIRQQACREVHDGSITHVIRPVKTYAGNREIPLPSWTVNALRDQHAQLKDMRSRAGIRWGERDLVFPGPLGNLLAQNSALVQWRRAVGALKLPNGKPFPQIRPHDLRHSKGTLMANEGEALVVISQTLGHAKTSITADLYVGKVPKALRQAADRYGALLDPGANGPE